MEAEQARDDAARLLRAGSVRTPRPPSGQLARADSLLAAAEREDPAWARPTVLRGWVAHASAPLSPTPAAREDAALAFAERALARAPGDARALELRGTMLFARALDASDGAAQAARLDRAEADLRAAVAAEPGLASAWGSLSQLLRYRGRVTESDAAARRALAEDAYLDGADVLLERLFFGALLAATTRRPTRCDQGGARRFPERLEVRAVPSDPASRRPVAAAGRSEAPCGCWPSWTAWTRPTGPGARGGPTPRSSGRRWRRRWWPAPETADSARAMLARARREAGSDAELRISLAYDEAYVQQVLGAPDSARALLAWAFTRRP